MPGINWAQAPLHSSPHLDGIIKERIPTRDRGQWDWNRIKLPVGDPAINLLAHLHIAKLQVQVPSTTMETCEALRNAPSVAMALSLFRHGKGARRKPLGSEEPVGSPAYDTPTLYAIAQLELAPYLHEGYTNNVAATSHPVRQ